jgi:hypothetical protein
MEAVRTSETSVYFNKTTWRYITEGYHFQGITDCTACVTAEVI